MRKKGKEIKCAVCDKLFYVKPCDLNKRKTCSVKCKSIYISGSNNPYHKVSTNYRAENSPLWKEKIEMICAQCGNLFYVKPSHVDIRKCCSRKCYANWMSLNLVGENNPNYGKEGKKLSENPNWKGGLSFQNYPPIFNKKLKQEIKDIHGYNCCLCSKSEEQQKEETHQKLSIHHIDYNKQNCDYTNLIVLCTSCNAKVNFNRDYYTEFFQNKIQEIRGQLSLA